MWIRERADIDDYFQRVNETISLMLPVENMVGQCGQLLHRGMAGGLSNMYQPVVHSVSLEVRLALYDLVENVQFVIELGVDLASISDFANGVENSRMIASTESVANFRKGK